MEQQLITPDGVTPSIVDLLQDIEDRQEDWADELLAAVELQARRQVARARCPIDLLDILDLRLAGQKTGRGAKTEQAALAAIADAVRSGGPRQGRLALDLGPAGSSRPPTKRGRPRKGGAK